MPILLVLLIIFVAIFGLTFQIVLVISALAIISVRNPIHSILWLMFSFVIAAVLLVKLGANFLGLIFIMVYVGAITVLFLYCVMLLNIRILDWSQYLYKYLPLGSFFGLVLTCQILYIYGSDFSFEGLYNINYLDIFSFPWLLNSNDILFNWYYTLYSKSNLLSIGSILYTNYGIHVVFGGVVLLVAMIGAIVLTLHKTGPIKKQSILKQQLRNIKSSYKF